MRSGDENSVLIVAPPGCGKSSLLAWSAAHASTLPDSPHVLPIYVPVGHHATPSDTAVIVSGVAEGIAIKLAANLKKREREELERALAITITTARQPTRLRAGLSLPPLHGLTLQLAAELGGDLATVVKAGGWQGGPHAGLVALADLARAKNARLVVVMDDTDIWSAGDENMARRAGEFFAAVRSLLDCPDVTLLAAVQNHWASTKSLPRGSDQTAAARLQFTELRERAGRVMAVPLPASLDHARALVRAVLDRRIDITLEPPAPEGGWVDTVFSAGAIDVLAKRCLERSVRHCLTDVRDAFDHHAGLPPRIERDHIIEAMSA
jgi:AAA ATPase domain